MPTTRFPFHSVYIFSHRIICTTCAFERAWGGGRVGKLVSYENAITVECAGLRSSPNPNDPIKIRKKKENTKRKTIRIRAVCVRRAAVTKCTRKRITEAVWEARPSHFVRQSTFKIDKTDRNEHNNSEIGKKEEKANLFPVRAIDNIEKYRQFHLFDTPSRPSEYKDRRIRATFVFIFFSVFFFCFFIA